MLTPSFHTISPKKLIGMHTRMSLVENKTFQLWSSFMPRRKEIRNSLNEDLFSIQVYGPGYFQKFDPNTSFEKWAAVEVSDQVSIPDGMSAFDLPGGLYAVFHYKGPNTDFSVFEHIFRTWLPVSGYALDNRPHFEVMGEKYKNNDPESEEDIWVPVRKK